MTVEDLNCAVLGVGESCVQREVNTDAQGRVVVKESCAEEDRLDDGSCSAGTATPLGTSRKAPMFDFSQARRAELDANSPRPTRKVDPALVKNLTVVSTRSAAEVQQERQARLRGESPPCSAFARAEGSIQAANLCITFGNSATALTDQDVRNLAIFADFLSGSQLLRELQGGRALVRIVGHANRTGAEDVNVSLSEQRAKTVLLHLQGLPQIAAATHLRFEAEGKGSQSPLAGVRPESGENRRVEAAVYLAGK